MESPQPHHPAPEGRAPAPADPYHHTQDTHLAHHPAPDEREGHGPVLAAVPRHDQVVALQPHVAGRNLRARKKGVAIRCYASERHPHAFGATGSRRPSQGALPPAERSASARPLASSRPGPLASSRVGTGLPRV